jgi:hypothetical protein
MLKSTFRTEIFIVFGVYYMFWLAWPPSGNTEKYKVFRGLIAT